MKALLAALLLSVQLASAATFAWEPSEDATFYLLYESVDAGLSWSIVEDATADTHIDYTGVFADALYRVTANNSAGESAPSNVVEITTLQTKLSESVLNVRWYNTISGAVLQESTDLVNWTTAQLPIDTRSSARKFFRLKP